MAYTKTNWKDYPNTSTKLTAENLNKIENGIYNMPSDIYPVGSVYTTSTNTNPSTILGGTWQLIGKGFQNLGISSNNIFSRNTSNTSSAKSYLTRNGQVINLHISVTTSVTLGESGAELGTVNFSYIGISNLMSSIFSAGISDSGNGVAMVIMRYDTGVIDCIDVVTKTSGGTIPANSIIDIDFSFVCLYNQMLDEKCNQFIWKRTA